MTQNTPHGRKGVNQDPKHLAYLRRRRAWHKHHPVGPFQVADGRAFEPVDRHHMIEEPVVGADPELEARMAAWHAELKAKGLWS